MLEIIQSLDDVKAQQILGAFTRARSAAGDPSIQWSSDLGLALANEFRTEQETAAVSNGELARQALQVLAEDPETRKAIETMASAPAAAAQKFDFGVTIGLTTAVLIVLQTHVRFERGAGGKWSLKVEKKPTSDALLKGLVQKLISYAK